MTRAALTVLPSAVRAQAWAYRAVWTVLEGPPASDRRVSARGIDVSADLAAGSTSRTRIGRLLRIYYKHYRMALKSGLLGSMRQWLCCHSPPEESEPPNISSVRLDPKVRVLAEHIFREMDLDGNGRVSKAETMKWWGSFAKVNTRAMFEAVDFDASGEISLDEWLKFWMDLVSRGRSVEDVIEELELIQEKISWAELGS